MFLAGRLRRQLADLAKSTDELQKALDRWTDGDVDGAEKHYEKALYKFDEALDLID